MTMSARPTRRDVLRTLSLSTFGAATSSAWADTLSTLAHTHAHSVVAPPAADWVPKVLDARQNETVVALTEAIIPATITPGAKAGLVNRFIDAVLEDADARERKEFLRGLAWVDARCLELFDGDFVAATPEQQTALLTLLSSEKNRTVSDQIGVEFFRAIKSMTITGYYTSEVGMREELGDDGQVFFTEFQGCTHTEHGAPTSRGAKPTTTKRQR